ncbi:FAD:protein FMN transferase [Kangiella sediminilitoris]|uniref:FAD:protein FMN transferase n=1 Tax=Kangiella sediminilitoris TaxID=1144748 RepID=A0A1B3B852_9GAMM|nr:FAD:protein FMN transferase [Kangiella sediminilitoris]AOE48982.1 ApbE family lipoprotein [Kangiella sediminilitoris]
MRLSILSFLLLLLISCAEEPEYTKITGSTMGTTYSVIVQSEGVNTKSLYQDIEQELKDINQLMSTYIPDSEINTFNQLKDSSCFKFSDRTWEVLVAAKQIYLETNGAFDITLGPLISRWGFNVEEYDIKVPSDSEIQQLLQQVGTDKLDYNHNSQCISKQTPAITINLSAIAKGYGVDQVATIVEQYGVYNYLVEIGGETVAKGVNPAGAVWRIAIEKPVDLKQQQMLIIGLADTSIATSGDYRNYFEVDGLRFSHTIDPKTGHPVTHNLTSVSVIHESNMYADAYATALTVMGKEKAIAFANKHRLPIFLINHLGDELQTDETEWFTPFIINGALN